MVSLILVDWSCPTAVVAIRPHSRTLKVVFKWMPPLSIYNFRGQSSHGTLMLKSLRSECISRRLTLLVSVFGYGERRAGFVAGETLSVARHAGLESFPNVCKQTDLFDGIGLVVASSGKS
jgi:hypothetical protein